MKLLTGDRHKTHMVVSQHLFRQWLWFTRHEAITRDNVDPDLCRHMASLRRYESAYCKNRITLRWRHNGRDCVSNHQPYDCLLNRLFRRKSKKTSKLRVTGLCAGNSPGTGEFPAQMASYAENVSIWWRHHEWGLSPGRQPELELFF